MKTAPDPLNLIICGVGGQGNILISRLIGRCLSAEGYNVDIGETFGAAQRGGAVYSSMRISKEKHYGPLVPVGRGHVIVGLEPLETIRTLKIFGNPEVITLTNLHPIYPVGVLAKRSTYPDIKNLKAAIRRLSGSCWFLDAASIANRLGEPIAANMVMLGALLATGKIPLQLKQIEKEIRNRFGGTRARVNLEAVRAGFARVHEEAGNAGKSLKLP